MDKELIFIVEESEEGGYIARAIGVSIFTDGDTISELKNNIKEAVICHFDEGKAPKTIKLHFIKEELMAV
jgi:predicted RNase H-like HicB family nuclease